MDSKKVPIGIELVRKGVIQEADIQKALDYQKRNPSKKIGDILYILKLAEPIKLIEAIGELSNEKGIILSINDINVNVSEFISIDTAINYKAIPFDVVGGRIKVCFADTTNTKTIESVRLLFLNKGLLMDKYITFETIVDEILDSLTGNSKGDIEDSDDITRVIDNIIKSAMQKRASDIHFEPLEQELRVRYRIDGELFTIATLPVGRQSKVMGRLKAISNMHQEKQESQDGRIILYKDYNIRVSSQKNIHGEKFVLRLLKKNAVVEKLTDLGFPGDEETIEQSFNKRNSITIMAAPTGEGKTTSLYSIIDHLNRPEINITTIEDPVEIRIDGLNQIEITEKTSFSDSLRTVLRQDPDIILVGEIRDKETAEIAFQAGQTGHYVLSTIHTIDAVEVITRLRKIGISNYDISSTLATSVSQRLVRKLCPDCKAERDFTADEIKKIEELSEKYKEKFDLTGKKTYDAVGCEKCNHVGYVGRLGLFEILVLNDEIKELIVENASSFDIKREGLKYGYKPLAVDGIRKVLSGITTLEEINYKLVLF